MYEKVGFFSHYQFQVLFISWVYQVVTVLQWVEKQIPFF